MMDLDERIEAYLEGLLSTEESDLFERELVEPEVAEAFAEALMLRELLRTVPPEQPPDALVARLETSVFSQLQGLLEERSEPKTVSRLRTALNGVAWTWRGPGLAMPVTGGGSDSVKSGLSTLRYALGPYGDRVVSRTPKAGKAVRGLLGRLWRRK
jgi:hypothetical protein